MHLLIMHKISDTGETKIIEQLYNEIKIFSILTNIEFEL